MKIPKINKSILQNLAWKNVAIVIVAVLVLFGFEEQQARKYAPEIESVLENVKEQLETVESEEQIVSKVYDGDTFTLQNGERVRLIGINAPEIGEAFATSSRDYLASLILGKSVVLVADKTDKDKYGRMLRYVYANGEFVNEAIVKAGLAWSRGYYPDTKEQVVLDSAMQEAKDSKVGIWQ